MIWFCDLFEDNQEQIVERGCNTGHNKTPNKETIKNVNLAV